MACSDGAGDGSLFDDSCRRQRAPVLNKVFNQIGGGSLQTGMDAVIPIQHALLGNIVAKRPLEKGRVVLERHHAIHVEREALKLSLNSADSVVCTCGFMVTKDLVSVTMVALKHVARDTGIAAVYVQVFGDFVILHL